MRVVHLDILLAVVDHADLCSGEFYAERVPGIAGDGRVDVLERVAPSVRGVVERDVVLERVGARDVVVVAVLPAPHHSARLVFAAGDRLELHFHPAVGERHVGSHAPRKGAAAGLLEHVRPAGGRRVDLDDPSRRAAAGHAGLPARGNAADEVGVETGGLRHRCRGYQACHDDESFHRNAPLRIPAKPPQAIDGSTGSFCHASMTITVASSTPPVNASPTAWGTSCTMVTARVAITAGLMPFIAALIQARRRTRSSTGRIESMRTNEGRKIASAPTAAPQTPATL